MIEIDLATLKKLCVAATPGPWELEIEDGVPWYILGAEKETIVTTDCGFYGPELPDAEFIAASRTALPQLIEALEVAHLAMNNEIPTLSAAFIKIGELDKENQSLRDQLKTYEAPRFSSAGQAIRHYQEEIRVLTDLLKEARTPVHAATYSGLCDTGILMKIDKVLVNG